MVEMKVKEMSDEELLDEIGKCWIYRFEYITSLRKEMLKRMLVYKEAKMSDEEFLINRQRAGNVVDVRLRIKKGVRLDEIYQDVLMAIANGAENVQELAKEAIKA